MPAREARRCGGVGTEINGRYFLNDHGSYIRVTHTAYLHAVALTQRLLSAIPSVFYALGKLVNYPDGAGVHASEP